MDPVLEVVTVRSMNNVNLDRPEVRVFWAGNGVELKWKIDK